MISQVTDRLESVPILAVYVIVDKSLRKPVFVWLFIVICVLLVENGSTTLENANVVFVLIIVVVVTFQMVTTLFAMVIFLMPTVPLSIVTVLPMPLILNSVGKVTTNWSDTSIGERLMKLKLTVDVA